MSNSHTSTLDRLDEHDGNGSSRRTSRIDHSRLDRDVTHGPRRAVAATGLAGIALIHMLDLPGKISETPYLGYAYIGLVVAALVLAEMLLRRDDAKVWAATAGLTAAVIAGYVINRTVGMPNATGDIGNWLEPIGLASLAVEGFVLLLAVGRLTRR